MFYNYILYSEKARKLYIGFTRDLKRRIIEHNQGKNFSTKPYKPWKLIYYEACLNEEDAKRREKYLKTTQGQRLIRRRLKEFFYEGKIYSKFFYGV
jgi:putative endonuclease